MTHSTPVMETTNLTVGYPGKTVLSRIAVRFAPGEFVSVLGPNGAGKTTLLRTLARLLAPLSGRVIIESRELQLLKQQDLARTLSVVLTERISPGLFTVFEFVALGRYPHTGFMGRLNDEDRHAVREALSQVHAIDLEDRRLETLSDGEKQKVFLARALAQEPKIILLDEPTLHLDLRHRLEVMRILRRLCRERGITVVASLHDVDIAVKVSDQVILVKNGRIVDWGSPERVLDGSRVASLYDFSGVHFDPALGSIELRSEGALGTVFVVGGIGSASGLYRALAKCGFAIRTGIIHENDLDRYVAESVGAECIVCPAMRPIQEEHLSKAEKLLEGVSVVIDSGFPVEPLNALNLELLRKARRHRIPIFSRRDEESLPEFRPGETLGIRRFQNDGNLIRHLCRCVLDSSEKTASPIAGKFLDKD